MDVIFSYPSFLLFLFLFLFFLPDLACSSPNGLPCSPFEIIYPFTSVSSAPNFIQCIDSKPMIRFNNQEPSSYVVIDLTYDPNILIIQQDQNPTPLFQGSDCDFIYVFEDPRPRFDPALLVQSLGSKPTIFNCNPTNYNFSGDIFNHSTGCSNYTIHYSDGSANQIHDDPSCLASQTPSFEWKMSFGVYLDDFPLLSAGSIYKLEVHPNCFNCHIKRENCTTDLTTGNSMCTCGSRCPSTSKGKGTKIAIGKGKGTKIAIVVTAGTSSIFLVFLLICLYLYRANKSHNQIIVWKSSKRPPSIESFLEKNGSLAPKRYQYSNVKKMTKSFSDKLGQGGYGVVYKGKLHDGRYVAVKVLSSSKGNGEEFVNEVASIGRTSHVNVVSLVGFCYEGSKRALIYDFMPNGSLEKFIYSERSETIPLGWERLFNIAVGIARGLEYLHRGCNTRIVHFDIKPHNILLDQDFCPKISDFGLSKLCRPKESFISMCGARGTPGYIAPEILFRNFGAISGKSDVYSYGMMVLEMVGGRKNVNIRAEKTSEIYFPHWIYEHQDQDGDLQVCGVTNETVGVARKMIIVGLWCIQTMPQSRPSISRVLEMLEGSIDGLQLPPKPSLSSPPRACGAPITGST